MAENLEAEDNKLGLSPELQKKYDDLLFEFGIKMHAGRKKYRLTQEDVAAALNLIPKSGKQRISQIETGKVPVKFPFMMRIADLFGMELEIRWVIKKPAAPRKKAKGKEDSSPKEEETKTSSTRGLQ